MGRERARVRIGSNRHIPGANGQVFHLPIDEGMAGSDVSLIQRANTRQISWNVIRVAKDVASLYYSSDKNDLSGFLASVRGCSSKEQCVPMMITSLC